MVGPSVGSSRFVWGLRALGPTVGPSVGSFLGLFGGCEHSVQRLDRGWAALGLFRVCEHSVPMVGPSVGADFPIGFLDWT